MHSVDFEDQVNHSREISKDKFSLDVSAIDSVSKMQHGQNKSKEQDMAIKEMSHFGGSMQNQSIYSVGPQDTQQSTSMPPAPRAIRLKFNAPRVYESNVHQDVLAMAKPEYHGKDFF